jgi:hypothetical protein
MLASQMSAIASRGGNVTHVAEITWRKLAENVASASKELGIPDLSAEAPRGMDLLDLGRHLKATRELATPPSNLAGCISSAIMAAVFTAWAGIYAANIATTCEYIRFANPPSSAPSVQQKECAVDILYMASAITFMGDFVSQAVSDCSPIANKGAQCAAGALGATASLARVGGSATAASITCGHDPGAIKVSGEFAGGDNGVWCGFDITLAVTWILSSAGSIVGAIGTCRPPPHEEACAMNIMKTVGAATMGGGSIASAVSDCSTLNLGALCAGDILECIGAVSWLGASGVVMAQACR